MTGDMVLDVAALAFMLLAMLGEARLAAGHDRRLRARGAVEPAGDVYRLMQWMYPGAFIVIAGEGALGTGPGARWVAAGLAVLALGKAVKYWAIASLGERWTFRVLVPPGAPAVTSGPYRWLRHPNYVGVLGELLGFALLLQAPWSGALAVAGFGVLLRRRIRVEEGALGLR